jgi:hypothetical protein
MNRDVVGRNIPAPRLRRNLDLEKLIIRGLKRNAYRGDS